MLELFAILVAAGFGVGIFGCLVVAGACRGSLNEANEEEHYARRQLDLSGPICAWCHPGVDCPAGHAICPACFEKQMAAFREHQSEGGA